jgi:transposase
MFNPVIYCLTMNEAVFSHTEIEQHVTRSGEHNLRSGKGPRRKLTDAEIETVLAMYREGEKTTAEIAEGYGIHPSIVTYMAKRAGLSLRGRGGRPRVEPSAKVQEILLEAWTTTYAEAAVRFNVSKQRVGQLVKRWHAWAVAQFGPREIKPQDVQVEQVPCPANPVRPHVITFRVTDSELAKLLAEGGNRPDPWGCSPHSTARFLLFRSLGPCAEGGCENRDAVGVTQ